jgi:MFS family permease
MANITHMSGGIAGLRTWRDLKNVPRELWILCLATFVNRVGAMALPFLVLYLTGKLGFTAGSAGAMLALYGGVSLIAGPMGGRLADRWGARPVMLVSLAASGLALMLFPLAHSVAAVAVMTIFVALTTEAFRPAILAIFGEFGSGDLGKLSFALMRFSSNLGMSVGPAAGGFLAQVSFPALFVIDGMTSLFAAAIAIGTVAQHTGKPEMAENRGFFGVFRHDVDFRIFLIGIIPAAAVFSQISSALPLFMVHTLHLSESAYGLLFTLNTVMVITMEIPLNSMTSHWQHTRSMALGAILMGVGFGALAFAKTYFHVLLTVAIWTLGEMMLFPSMSFYVSDIAPEGRKGEYMGLYMMSFNLAFRLAGPWAGVVLLEKMGPVPLWLGMFGAASVSSALLVGLRTER